MNKDNEKCKHCGYEYNQHYPDVFRHCPVYTTDTHQFAAWNWSRLFEEIIMEKKIKKGRYKGQPEGTPDCEIYVARKGEKRYITPEVWGGVRLSFTADGLMCNSCAGAHIEDGIYIPIYEPELYKPKPYDRVGSWGYNNSQIYIYFWRRVSPSWPNAILITEEMVQSETVPTTPEEVEEMDRRGKIIWIKRGQENEHN